MPASRRCAALALAAAAVLLGAGARAQGTVEVEADHLRLDHRNGTARFEGHVQATYGKLKLSCDELRVGYADDGTVSSLEATGSVVVRRGEARATAAAARLDARQGLLVLQGGPVLVQGANRLEGRRITVRLSDGRLDVVGARGKFVLGKGAPR